MPRGFKIGDHVRVELGSRETTLHVTFATGGASGAGGEATPPRVTLDSTLALVGRRVVLVSYDEERGCLAERAAAPDFA